MIEWIPLIGVRCLKVLNLCQEGLLKHADGVVTKAMQREVKQKVLTKYLEPSEFGIVIIVSPCVVLQELSHLC